MKNLKICQKIICAATAAAMLAMPLLACGDDEEKELHSERVTDAEWEERYIAMASCKNYTITAKVNDSGKNFTIVTKCDIDSHIASFNDENGNMNYWVLEPYENEYYGPNSFWCIEVTVDKNGKISIDKDPIRDIKHINKYVGNRYTPRGLNYYNREKYDFTFNSDKNCYESIKKGKWVWDNEIEDNVYMEDITVTCRAYFSSKYQYACYYSDDKITMDAHASDFGTTKVKVPADVKAKVEEYKSTHEPPVEEEEY